MVAKPLSVYCLHSPTLGLISKKMNIGLVLALVSAVTSLAVGSAKEDPIVSTPLGYLRGYRLTSRGGREFLAFSGLPYAQPPVGHLRFEGPRAASSWNGTREAKTDGPPCLQLNMYQKSPSVRGVEDCLYLSLYTHNVSGRAAVMVHFHGGGFVAGNGANSMPQYLMDEDIVLVNVNFRVGILGFFSLEDGVMPGNQGMKDQTAALRWVRENIHRFGGDPDCVTIMGESAGGRSVYLHTVSPLSRGLFQRAIAESGTTYTIGTVMPKGYVRGLSLRLAGLTNCKRNSSQDIVACLRTLPAQDIVSQLIKFRKWQIDPIATFRIVFEEGPDAFITYPIDAWQHAHVPILMGTTSADGLLRAQYLVTRNVSWEWYNEHFHEVAPLSMGYDMTASDPDEVTKQIRNFYFPNQEITQADWPTVVQMYSDSGYIMGSMEGADKHPGNVYFYFFDYLGQYSMAGNFNRSLITGSAHTEEIIYLWKLANIPFLTGQDLILSKKLVKLWTNFAKFGNPTPRGSEFTWQRWKPREHRHLYISNDGLKMEKGLAEDRYRFWTQLNYRDNYDKPHYRQGGS